MQVGFIGTGSMGSILIEAFIEAKSLPPSHIHASNRSFCKVKDLARTYTGLHAYPTNTLVAEKADLLFLCIKPFEYRKVIDDIGANTHSDQIVISITSPVEVKELERMLPAKIVKIIPSITNSVQSGASLMIAGDRLSEKDKNMLYTLMKTISQPIWINERYTRVSSDISSCGPAFISYILQHFIDAAVRETGIPREQATLLTGHMIMGLGELLSQKKYTLQTLQERVCVPGGVTGAGIKILENEVNDMFDQLFQETHSKHDTDLQELYHAFHE